MTNRRHRTDWPSRTTRAAALAAVMAALSPGLLAQTVTITCPRTINPGDTTIQPCEGGPAVPLATADIVVLGTTLTMTGTFTVHSLEIRHSGSAPGVLVHAPEIAGGLDLTITDHFLLEGPAGVAPPSRIDLTGRGLPGSQGNGQGGAGPGANGGGAGYGGAGGDAANSAHLPSAPGVGGACYGFDSAGIAAPRLLGSGGGNASSGGNILAGTGGKGGGAIRLAVGGTATIDGQIIANGTNGNNPGSGTYAGGGSGGSVFITCGTLDGGGSIAVDGGAGQSGNGGGGGGGRISLVYATNASTLTTTAFGAPGSVRGGAGTVFTKRVGDPRGTLVIDNNNAAGETTEFYGNATLVDMNVVVRNLGRLGPPHFQSNSPPDNGRLNLTIDGDLTVDTSGVVFADGRGSPGSIGLGAGGSADGRNGGGGGYGGAGGDAEGSSRGTLPLIQGLGGACHGFDATNLFGPNQVGSGGGNAFSGGNIIVRTGGAGGGGIRLTVTGVLRVDGQITAHGAGGNNPGSGTYAGGGSGGSIFITCGTLTGSTVGAIAANGGAGQSSVGGGGGGGRIAVFYTTSTLANSQIRAFGATGENRGGAGTVVLKRIADPRSLLIIDNNDNDGETTEFYGPVTLASTDVIVRGHGHLGPPHFESDADIRTNGQLDLTVGGDLTVEPSGRLYAVGRGYVGSSGPGAGNSSAAMTNGSGAGYGGAGGRGQPQTPEGTPYGGNSTNIVEPTMLGSGGGNAYSGGNAVAGTGGAGGGMIRLTVNGTLRVDGQLNASGANGNNSGSGGYAGAGAGGSIDVYCLGALEGTGTIMANGGAGQNNIGGGGGGGRVAIHSCQSVPFLPVAPGVQVNGGPGFQAGVTGSKWFGPLCPADYDCNNALEPADVARFVAVWFTSLQQPSPAGDFDANGTVQPADVAQFVSHWFNTLSTGC